MRGIISWALISVVFFAVNGILLVMTPMRQRNASKLFIVCLPVCCRL